MNKINTKQAKLLEENNYFVMPELNVIKDKSFEKPLFNIYFDEHANEFGLQIFGALLQDPNAMLEYSKQLNWRFKLIEQLNFLGDKK